MSRPTAYSSHVSHSYRQFTMRSSFSYQALAAACLLPAALAAPAAVPDRVQMKRGAGFVDRRQASADVPTATPIGPSGASGSLRGPASLAGYNPNNPIQTDSTQIPSDEYQLAPGQTENEDLGIYLDFSKVENPQPIRGGTNSPTDPGPSKCGERGPRDEDQTLTLETGRKCRA